MTDGDPSPNERDEQLRRILRERREFLQGLAATAGGALAGCSGTTDDGTDRGTDDGTDRGTDDGTDSPPTGGTASRATETPEPTPTPVEAPRADSDAYEDSPARPPGEALETLRVAPGHEVELVASEPLLEHPVDIEWDDRGRLWVVEMPDYMVSIEGDAPRNESPNGRITVLEDPDGDGEMERRTVFLDDLTLPRSLAFVDGGVLVAAPPNLVYCEYDAETLELEHREVVMEGYGADFEDPEHTENGLVFGLDNWLYSAHADARLRYRDGELEVEGTHSRGQWGIDRDDYGRLFYTWNSTWLFGDLIPGEYPHRDDDVPDIGIGESLVDTQLILTVRENRGLNRAYRDGYLRDDGRMKTNDAVSGPGIYRGDLLDANGSAFVPDPAGHCVARIDLDGDPASLALESDHRVYDDDEWGHREFLASTDEVFRPVYAKTGPDGALYVVDMYKGIIQHVKFLTGYLQRYILENDLHKVPPAGRIYRVVPDDESPDSAAVPNLADSSPSELASTLEHPNGRIRDTAQRLLVDRQSADGTATLREIARSSDDPVARIHALWTLRGLSELDAETAFTAMDADDPYVTAAAIRTGEGLLGTEDAEAYVSRVTEVASTGGQRVVVQAAHSLGEALDSEEESTARETLESLREEYDTAPYVVQAVKSAPGIDD